LDLLYYLPGGELNGFPDELFDILAGQCHVMVYE
jgi:hypothetical protein